MLEKLEVENVQHNHSLASKVNLRRFTKQAISKAIFNADMPSNYFIFFTRDPVRKGGELSIKAG